MPHTEADTAWNPRDIHSFCMTPEFRSIANAAISKIMKIAALNMTRMPFFLAILSHQERIVGGILQCNAGTSCYCTERIFCDMERYVDFL